MKLKIISILILFLVVVILFYGQNNIKKINYTILGEKTIYSNNIVSKNFSDIIYDKLSSYDNFGDYNQDFITENIRIIDIINDINDNKLVNDKSIQNLLKDTNLLLIYIGSSELNYKLSKIDPEDNNDKIIYNYLDEVQKDMKTFLELIRRYNDGNIIILGLYNDTNNTYNDKYYEYINEKIKYYSNKNNMEFINTYEILNKNKDYITKTTPIYITNDGNMALFNKIYSKIDKLYLHKVY